MRLPAHAAVSTNVRVLDELRHARPVVVRPGTRTAAALTQAINCHSYLHGSALARELAAEYAAQLWHDHEELPE